MSEGEFNGIMMIKKVQGYNETGTKNAQNINDDIKDEECDTIGTALVACKSRTMVTSPDNYLTGGFHDTKQLGEGRSVCTTKCQS